MPSPKTVLRDISDLKLDPKKVHTWTSRSGRLANVVIDNQKHSPPPPNAPDKSVRAGLVELPSESVEDVKSPPEVPLVIEEVVLVEEQPVEHYKKKDKYGKKVSKKDEPEDPHVR